MIECMEKKGYHSIFVDLLLLELYIDGCCCSGNDLFACTIILNPFESSVSFLLASLILGRCVVG